MKSVLGIILLVMVLFTNTYKTVAQQSRLSGQISLSGAFALYPMVVKWAEEFRKIHPNVRIDISGGGAGKGITDVLTGMVDLGMVSREIHADEIRKGAFAIPVAIDAVVPTINAKHPRLNEVLRKGISREAAIKIYITGEFKTWGDLLSTNYNAPIRLFTRSDACGAAETWAQYLNNKKQEDLLGTAVFGDPGLASAVFRNALALGYNNIAYAYNNRTKKPNEGILVIPIDINNNNRIDPEENFYATSDQLVKAIADGRFPSPPARELYLVSRGKPQKPVVVAFIKYILTEGQKHNIPLGFVNLPKVSLNRALKALN